MFEIEDLSDNDINYVPRRPKFRRIQEHKDQQEDEMRELASAKTTTSPESDIFSNIESSSSCDIYPNDSKVDSSHIEYESHSDVIDELPKQPVKRSNNKIKTRTLKDIPNDICGACVRQVGNKYYAQEWGQYVEPIIDHTHLLQSSSLALYASFKEYGYLYLHNVLDRQKVLKVKSDISKKLANMKYVDSSDMKTSIHKKGWTIAIDNSSIIDGPIENKATQYKHKEHWEELCHLPELHELIGDNAINDILLRLAEGKSIYDRIHHTVRTFHPTYTWMRIKGYHEFTSQHADIYHFRYCTLLYSSVGRTMKQVSTTTPTSTSSSSSSSSSSRCLGNSTNSDRKLLTTEHTSKREVIDLSITTDDDGDDDDDDGNNNDDIKVMKTSLSTHNAININANINTDYKTNTTKSYSSVDIKLEPMTPQKRSIVTSSTSKNVDLGDSNSTNMTSLSSDLCCVCHEPFIKKKHTKRLTTTTNHHTTSTMSSSSSSSSSSLIQGHQSKGLEDCQICQECGLCYHLKCLSLTLDQQQQIKKNNIYNDWYCSACQPRHILGTTWIPLGDISIDEGVLGLLPGSQHLPGINKNKGRGMTWHVSPYQAGDIVLFDSMTVHGTSKNYTDHYRYSVDSRWYIWPERANSHETLHGQEVKKISTAVVLNK